jgi:DNA repair photolyase
MTTKSVIYEPQGRAGEYSELALNLYTGCPNGCKYCYVPDVLHMPAEEFHRTTRPRLTLADIEESADIYGKPPARQLDMLADKKVDTRNILLCFTCDPYPQGGSSFTRDAIRVLKSRGLRITILTKNPGKALNDCDLLVPGEDKFGVTLTTILSVDSAEWEPWAQMPGERMAALKRAHDLGLETWVSLEPVINPEWTIKLMEMTRGFASHYKVGKMNYHPHAKTINWQKFGWDIKRRMDELGVKYYLKRDLIQEMGIR